jgi:hypothetical protein
VLLLISLSLSLSTIIELDWSYLLFIYFMEIISEQNKRQSEECRQLKALLEDLESMFFITYWNFYASSLHSLFRFRSSVCY